MPSSPQPSLVDLFNTGTLGSLSDEVILDLSGVSGGKAVVSGTWTGTIIFEQTIDFTRWDRVGTFSGTTGAFVAQTGIITNDILVFVGIAGAAQIRARFLSYTSGSASVVLRGSNGVSNVFIDNLVPANLKTEIFGKVKTSVPNTIAHDANSGLITNPYGILAIEANAAFYSRWGIAFSATTDRISTGSNSESPFLLVVNPVSNIKSLKLQRVHLSEPDSLNQSTVYRFYMNPTVTSNGTPLTAVGGRQNGQAASTVFYSKLPIVSAKGTLFDTVITTFGVDREINFDLRKWIEPGNSLLITAQQSIANNNQSVTIESIEE